MTWWLVSSPIGATMHLLEGVRCPGTYDDAHCEGQRAEIVAYMVQDQSQKIEVRLKCVRCEYLWTESLVGRRQ